MRAMIWLAPVLALAAGAGCEDTAGPRTATYVVEVSGEQFRVRAEGAARVAALEARLASGTTNVVLGRLVEGDGGFNEPWSWHLDPSTVETPDLAIELCDGRPSMVEADMDYWLDQVQTFCPWGAKVVSRIQD